MAIRSLQTAGKRDHFDDREKQRAEQMRKWLAAIDKNIAAYYAINGNLENQGFEEFEGGKESDGVASFRHHDGSTMGVERAIKALQRSGFGAFTDSRGIMHGSADIKGVRVSALIHQLGTRGVVVMLTFGGA
jgi:hypothetical protein